MIRRNRGSPAGRRARDAAGRASEELSGWLSSSFVGKMPTAYLTGVSKKYGKGRCLHEEDRFVQRFVEEKGYVSTNKLVDYLRSAPTYQKGQALPDEAVRRVYHNCSDSQGRLTCEYLIRMAEEVGVSLSDKEAREMVRKYANRKQFLSLEDCLQINERRRRKTSLSKTPSKKK